MEVGLNRLGQSTWIVRVTLRAQSWEWLAWKAVRLATYSSTNKRILLDSPPLRDIQLPRTLLPNRLRSRVVEVKLRFRLEENIVGSG